MATEAIGSTAEASGIKEEGKSTFSSPVGTRGGVCPLCKKEVKKDLKEHIKRVHLSKDDVMCELCGKTMTKHRLQNHIMHVHEQIRDKICDICGFKSYSNPELKLHIQRVHEGVKKERKWPCPYCEYIARSKIIRDNHVKAVHEKTRDMRCPLCEEIFVTINHLNKHIRDFHLDLQRDKCAECGFVGNTARELISHLRDAHGIRKTCPKCGFVEKKVHTIGYSVHTVARNYDMKRALPGIICIRLTYVYLIRIPFFHTDMSKKSRRLCCVIPRCKLQCRMTQPILRLF